jgi:hypothetical protein
MERIKAVNVEAIIDQLILLWNMGVDYVDVHGIPSEKKDESDTIVFSFSKDYMDPELMDKFDEFTKEDSEEEQTIKIKPTDLDGLI